jgi:hypothetical protein
MPWTRCNYPIAGSWRSRAPQSASAAGRAASPAPRERLANAAPKRRAGFARRELRAIVGHREPRGVAGFGPFLVSPTLSRGIGVRAPQNEDRSRRDPSRETARQLRGLAAAIRAPQSKLLNCDALRAMLPRCKALAAAMRATAISPLHPVTVAFPPAAPLPAGNKHRHVAPGLPLRERLAGGLIAAPWRCDRGLPR